MSRWAPLHRFTGAWFNFGLRSIRRLHCFSPLSCRSADRVLHSHSTNVRHPAFIPNVLHVNVPVHGGTAKVGYADVGPRDGSVILAIHGAPGGIADFAELYEPLSAAGIRFLVPEFPGFGNTTLDGTASFDESTEARAALIRNFLNTIGVTRVLAVAGHSLGSVAAFHLAANTDIFRSIIYLNGVGLRPHKSVSRYWQLTSLLLWLLENRWTKTLAARLLLIGYRQSGFTTIDVNELKSSFKSVTRLGFKQFGGNATRVREKNLPILFAFTQNDKLVEWQLQLEFAKHCGVMDTNVTWWDAFGNIVQGQNLESMNYPKALIFKRGGHHVYRSHADVILRSILLLTESIPCQK